jgi:hypothetical protein
MHLKAAADTSKRPQAFLARCGHRVYSNSFGAEMSAPIRQIPGTATMTRVASNVESKDVVTN